ncbi:MAG: hypothetical protein GY835_25215 [bacterium]|nr:hypothetical protein [bacterium]
MTANAAKLKVVGYRERGIVNELVYLIRSDGDPVGLTMQLLEKCFTWQNDEIKEQVSRIAEKMTDVTFIVEPSFAQFGDPDLIIVPRIGEKILALFFVEAKVNEYGHSAKLAKDPLNMKQRGFNSTIIGQLSLRYRLAKALSDWKEEASLVESNGIAQAYANNMKDVQTGSHLARSLDKPENLKYLLPLVQMESLSAAEFMERCFFLALTSDSSDPFEKKYPLMAEGKPLGYDDLSLDRKVPHYYQEEGSNTIYSQVAIDRTGWVGWDDINKNFSDILRTVPKSPNTWDLTFSDGRIKQKYSSNCTGDHRSISTHAWPEGKEDQDTMRNQWETIWLSNRSEDHVDGLAYSRLKGSDSGVFKGQTFFKLLNLKEEKTIALREDFGIELHPAFNRHICINGIPFLMAALPEGPELDEVKASISRYIEELRDKR